MHVAGSENMSGFGTARRCWIPQAEYQMMTARPTIPVKSTRRSMFESQKDARRSRSPQMGLKGGVGKATNRIASEEDVSLTLQA